LQPEGLVSQKQEKIYYSSLLSLLGSLCEYNILKKIKYHSIN
jgi:hypothetical protein